ncbi:AraC family transcriptional regulator [Anaerocolumna xylanovorans]|uniref:AraC-type DNA-binding protein n=1 Tax=Anaerocolumna xylanovorans DSM 12503 TaxID=1121345 RepID=A0A1M7XW90_9FIRM|nr:AraC family transcriptional regulator [Anaerocolumna xylanovorans]SHO42872.1 AraC-type DNA-binding protein [Anaerocolumna xylanovorans DSM 12503]
MLFSYNTDILPKVRMIGKINYINPWIHFERISNEFILYFIREGEMYLEENKIQYHLKKGDYFLLEPDLCHKGYKEAPCSYYYVHFKHPDLNRVDPKSEEQAITGIIEKRKTSLLSYNLDESDPTDPYAIINKSDSIADYQDYKGVLNIAVSIYNRREEHYKRLSSVEFHRFLMKIAHEFVLNNVTHTAGTAIKKSILKVDGILNYLNSNYMNKISSNQIEELYEVNFDYINRVFSEQTGHTIFQYLNSIRINHAKELISTTNLNFNEIAYLTGIEDQYYFSKIFKKYCGITPTQYYETMKSKTINQ